MISAELDEDKFKYLWLKSSELRRGVMLVLLCSFQPLIVYTLHSLSCAYILPVVCAYMHVVCTYVCVHVFALSCGLSAHPPLSG